MPISYASLEGYLKELPILGVTQSSLLSLHDPDLHEYARVIEQDEVLTSRFIKIANSVYYDRGGATGKDLLQSLTIIGLEEVKQFLEIYALKSTFSISSPEREALWQHNVLTALIARDIATSTRQIHVPISQAFLAGLLHDFGKLVLMSHVSYVEIFKKIQYEAGTFCEHELNLVPFCHCDVGAAVAEKWNLPSFVTDVMLAQHELQQHIVCQHILHDQSSVPTNAESGVPAKANVSPSALVDDLCNLVTLANILSYDVLAELGTLNLRSYVRQFAEERKVLESRFGYGLGTAKSKDLVNQLNLYGVC